MEGKNNVIGFFPISGLKTPVALVNLEGCDRSLRLFIYTSKILLKDDRGFWQRVAAPAAACVTGAATVVKAARVT